MPMGGVSRKRTRRNGTAKATTETIMTKVGLSAMEFTKTKEMRTGKVRRNSQRRTATEQTGMALTKDLRRASQMMVKIPGTKKMGSNLEPDVLLFTAIGSRRGETDLGSRVRRFFRFKEVEQQWWTGETAEGRGKGKDR